MGKEKEREGKRNYKPIPQGSRRNKIAPKIERMHGTKTPKWIVVRGKGCEEGEKERLRVKTEKRKKKKEKKNKPSTVPSFVEASTPGWAILGRSALV